MVGHARLRIARGDSGDELRSLGMSWDDGRAPGLAPAQGLFAVNEGDAVLLPYAAVTGGATLIENGANIAAEVNPRRGAGVAVKGKIRSGRDYCCTGDRGDGLPESHVRALVTMMLVIASGATVRAANTRAL